MPAVAIVAFVLIGLLAIAGAIFASQAARKRREELAAWAQARGWHYTPDEVSSLERRFPAFDVFRQGDNRYGHNVVRGDDERRDVWAFDYHYQTYSTDSKGNRTTHHHEFSAVIIDSGLQLAPLSLRAEGFFDRMKGVFGVDDIDFESAEFSRTFWVTSPDKRWAYDVIHQETMEFLLQSPRFALQMHGPYVLLHRSTTFKPFEFDQALRLGLGVLERIPRDIQERLRG